MGKLEINLNCIGIDIRISDFTANTYISYLGQIGKSADQYTSSFAFSTIYIIYDQLTYGSPCGAWESTWHFCSCIKYSNMLISPSSAAFSRWSSSSYSNHGNWINDIIHTYNKVDNYLDLLTFVTLSVSACDDLTTDNSIKDCDNLWVKLMVGVLEWSANGNSAINICIHTYVYTHI